MASWRFKNVTNGNALFWPKIDTISIGNEQPCQLAVLSATIIDEDADIELASKDELVVEFAANDVDYVKQFAGDLNSCVLTDTGRSSPRIYQITAQDYTKRLSDNIIDAERNVEESVTDRVEWIMGHCTQGISTDDLASISDLVDPRDYRGMSVRSALEEVAGEVGASFYVDFDKDLNFFVTPPVVAAPFDLAITGSNPPTSYPYWNFSSTKDTDEYAEAVYVQGEDFAVWRGTPGTYERSYSDPGIRTFRRAERIGDRILADLSSPIQTINLTLIQPGLAPGQTVGLVNTMWDINDDYLVRATQIRAIDPNGAGGGKMEMDVTLTDRFTPCYLRSPSAGDLARDGGGEGGDGGGVACQDCLRRTALLPSGMDSDFSLARGVGGRMHLFDGTTLQRYACDVVLLDTATPTAGDLGLIFHEPDTDTGLLAGDRLYYTNPPYGGTRWDNAADDVTAAAVSDVRKGWVVTGTSVGSFLDTFTRSTSDPEVGTANSGEQWLGPGGEADNDTVARINGTLNVDGDELHFASAGTTGEFEKTVRGSGKVWDLDSDFWMTATFRLVFVGAPASLSRLLVFGIGMNTEPVFVRLEHKTDGSFDLGIESIDDFVETNIPAGTITSGTSYMMVWYHQPNTNLAEVELYEASGPTLIASASATSTSSEAGAAASDGFSVYGSRDWDIFISQISITPVGGGLETRRLTDGSLVASASLPNATSQIRRTPNGQHVFVLQDTELRRYSRRSVLQDTVTAIGADFYTDLQDWNVADDYKIYRLADNVLYGYDATGTEMWAVDIGANEGYRFPTRLTAHDGGTGQQVVTGQDGNLRIVGWIGETDWLDGSDGLLLTINRLTGNTLSIRRFGGDPGDAAQIIALHEQGDCLWMAGAADGAEFEDQDLSGLTGWVMRVPPDTVGVNGAGSLAIGDEV